MNEILYREFFFIAVTIFGIILWQTVISKLFPIIVIAFPVNK